MRLSLKPAFLGAFCLVIFSGAWALAEPSPSLAALSFNMKHRDRPGQLRIMVDQLRADLRTLPDFVLCQEVVFGRRGEQDNTAEVLGDLLGYYTRGTKRRGDREGVAIVSRYPFIHYAERHLKSQTLRILLGFKRVSVMGEFLVPNIGRVRVVNVHLTNWGFEGHVRRKQIKETLEWIGQRDAVAPAAVTILGGDFNAKIEWGEMQQVTRKGSAGSLVFQNFNSQEPSMGLPDDPDKRIDFLFVASNALKPSLVQERLFWRDGLRDGSSRFYLSDHLCLLHVYSFEPAGGMAMTH